MRTIVTLRSKIKMSRKIRLYAAPLRKSQSTTEMWLRISKRTTPNPAHDRRYELTECQ